MEAATEETGGLRSRRAREAQAAKATGKAPAPKKGKAKKAAPKKAKPAKADKVTPATPPLSAEEKKANRAAALEAARAAKAKVKAEKEAEAAKARKDADKVLNPLAREINERMERAAKREAEADDHRLAAAYQLAEAEKKCIEAGIKFKAWAAEHITKLAWETARKLLAVGKSDNPPLALADLRKGAAKRNKEMRERQKRAKATATLPAPPKEAVKVAFERMADTERAEVIKAEAEKLGLSLGSSAPALTIEPAPELYISLVTVKQDFATLKASEKMAFVKWAAAEIGVSISMPQEFASAD